MIVTLEAKLAIDARDQLGEGPTWDTRSQRLLWSDNVSGVIHEAKADRVGDLHESRRWNLSRNPGAVRIGSNPLGAAIPRASGGLVVASRNEILLLDEEGHTEPLIRFPFERAHMNDAKCDPQGRLWVGTSTPDFTPGACALYRIDPDWTVTTMLENITTSNGPAWSPDGSILYYSDSPTLSLDAFDFDPLRGTISNRRSILSIDRAEGAPDGMTVDCEGCIWLAVIGAAGEVRRYAPDGTLLARVEASTPMVTSCAFGGKDGGDLFVTSAAFRVPVEVQRVIGFTAEMAENSASGPGAGGLFICRPGVMGEPATSFAG
jgi:sugar lactone lactonase YvrE